MESLENGNSKLNDGDLIQPCIFNGVRPEKEKECVRQDGSGTHAVLSISPTASLTSMDSSVSGCSDFSVDANSYGRGCLDEHSTDSGQDPNFGSNGHLRNTSLPPHVNGIYRSNIVVRNNFEGSHSVTNRFPGRDIDSTGSGGGQQAIDDALERPALSMDEETGAFASYDNDIDAQFWIPPDPEDQEADREGSVAIYDDDDDECVDGLKWANPSCFSSSGEGGSGIYRYREEKQKAMDEVMNGRFKAFVGQLLKSVGVAPSGEQGDNWVDIVTSLSWEAASFLRPDAIEGKAMDPDGYVKIKCVASGFRCQSQVIKGLVFKKHAAHKRMPTKCKNPRLLLIKGMLGLSSSGLSSFQTIEQEKDSLKPVVEMIELCQPNLVLVEKTVSRDMQESILAKGMTLVFDMKLHRLERVARCTGSQILSSDILLGPKLKQCDSFHFEKIEEEHAAVGEGGKRPCKTLMFLEGCPTRLGCTILLKGTHNEELKKIKCVVRCAVVMAYHSILETSFLLDQRAMFSTIPLNGVANLTLTDKQFSSLGSSEPNVACHEQSNTETESPDAIDIPISNGFHEEAAHNLNLGLRGDYSLSYEPYNPAFLSGFSHLSASLRKVIGDSLPLSCQSMSTYFGFNGLEPDFQSQTATQLLSSPVAIDHDDVEAKGSSNLEKALDHETQHSSTAGCEVSLGTQKSDGIGENQMQSKDDIRTVLDAESILVLMSSRNASRGTICEQSHFSHIKFYRNFDIPLGKFLRDNLLNQRLQCNTCGEPSEAHFYYYAHHNKQLSVQVRRLPKEQTLRGESEGKLWMWSRCGECKSCNGRPKSTKRVLISTAARGLSFGKFLELSFSNNSLLTRPSSCGHSFHKDFLYFFGLGPMVAMFKCSPVATYSVSLPPKKLEFGNLIRGDLLEEELKEVHMKGILLFLEVENSLKDIKSRFIGLTQDLQGSLREFSDIEELLKQERCHFEVDIQKTVKNENQDEPVCLFLSLNHLKWELLLESCLWDRRLYSLNSSNFVAAKQEQAYLEYGNGGQEANGADLESGEEVHGDTVDLKIKPETSIEASDLQVQEIEIEGQAEGCPERGESFTSSNVTEDTVRSTSVRKNAIGSIQDHAVRPYHSGRSHAGDESRLDDNVPSSAELHSDSIIPVTSGIGGGVHDVNLSQRTESSLSLSHNNLKDWIWSPLAEIRQENMKDLVRGYSPKFESVSSHASESTVHKLIADEGLRLHIPLGTDDYIISDYGDELSSIIACALALMNAAGDLGEDTKRDKGMDAKTFDSSHSFTRISSLNSPHWSSSGSSDSDGTHSSPGISLEEGHLSSFDGLSLLDSLVSLGPLHPEVSMGVGKLPGKGKYTVVCLYANQFCDLRNRCCPSELDYIASLSRCRNWDAKGGKSKSFFAKTLDDRFIIKEIKRTEFDSFAKFAPDYFQYMSQCYEQMNQTCLAKILGIYQVTRQTKSGKETKHDLMVMENLTFGRNITRQYDIKGALHARFTSAADGAGDVLLDQNFVNDMNASPLYISMKEKRHLQRAVWNDTSFLNSINVMDYSLLVGVDSQRCELVCGIIDYLRQYTWDKQLENWVKSSLVPKNQLPTIISPKEYKKRFRKFITTHFLTVPNRWCSQRSSNPCNLCGFGDDDDDSSHSRSSERFEHGNESSHAKSQEQGKQNGFSA